MPGTAVMWSWMSQVGSMEPKFAPTMQKGGFHTSFHSFIGAPLTLTDKQFGYMKSPTNSSVHSYRGYNSSSKMEQPSEENSSRQMQETIKICPIVNSLCNTNKKKKKKKRKRKKKKNKINNTENGREGVQPPRQRQVSIAESEDSFIIFFDAEIDERISELSENETETADFSCSSDCIIPDKKVRFAADSKLCEIHPMVMWSYAYQAARRGPWEEYARDRDRFHKRIVHAEKLISHVFDTEHRSRIYQQRFA